MWNNAADRRYGGNPINLILISIIVLIGFQQFPVLHIGGSLKIYEILGLLLLVWGGINKGYNLFSWLLFFFFIISPIVSLLSFFIFDGDVSLFYRVYPGARGMFRYNIYIFPFLQILFMALNYVVYSNLYYNRWIYRHFGYVKKWIVIVGTCIAVYSVVSMIIGDVVTKLPELIQNKHEYEYRSSGFSQEPSFYILYQGWIVLIICFSKKDYNLLKWIFILIVNLLALIFTFSSTLVVFVGIIALMIFLFSRLKLKILYLSLLTFSLYVGYITLSKYMDVSMLNYAFVEKVEDFVFGKDDAGGSGGFRHYESSLGWIIFEQNPILGVGVGNSIYYMHEADKKSPIIPMDEQLNQGSFPPNTFACVFAEQGLLGGVILLILLGYIFVEVWKSRNKRYGKLFLTGTVFNIATFLVIAPVYSMFLWVYMLMALGYIRYQKEKEMLVKIQRYVSGNRL